MNLKLALATLGVSVLAVSAAHAQVSIDPTSLVFSSLGGGIFTLDGTITLTPPPQPQNPRTFFVSDPNVTYSNGADYTETYPLFDLGLLPLVLSDNQNVGDFSFNTTLIEITAGPSAGATNGTVRYAFYDTDPTVGQPTPLGFATANFSIVPEPGTIALLVGMGVAGLAIRRRRK